MNKIICGHCQIVRTAFFALCITFMKKSTCAFQGKVPRNEYGNVELFLPSMLPKGTVHLQSKSL